MNHWTIAILPLFGAIIGAAVHFWFGKAAERKKHVHTLRAQAYADYLRAVAAAAHLGSEEDLRDALRQAADAKARICVYGSSRVIKALSRFEEVGAVLNNQHSTQAFVSLVSSMRSGGDAIPVRELELVLLGPERKGVSR
jgi:hypothetical protein